MAWQATCPRCSASIDADTRTCPSCGTDLAGEVVLLTEPAPSERAEVAVVEAGGDSRRRWLVVGAAVAAVVAVVAGLAVLGGGDGEQAGPSTPSSNVPTTAGPTSAPPQAGQSGGRGAITVGGQGGPLLDGPSQPALLVDDGSLATVDLATGEVRHPGTPVPIDLDAPLLLRDGGVVVVDRQGITHVLTPDLSQVVADLGAAQPLASGVADRVWLVSVDRTVGGGLLVEERTLTDEVTTESVALLPEVVPAGAVDAGLLLQTPAGIYLLPAGGGTPTRVAGGQYLGSNGATVARYDCDGTLTCSVHLTDVGTGDDTVPVLDGGVQQNGFTPHLTPGVAVFSPDGRLAAVPCACAAGEGMAVLNPATGEVVLRASGLENPVWAPDGGWLFGRVSGVVYAWPTTGTGDLDPIDLTLRGASLLGAVPSAP